MKIYLACPYSHPVQNVRNKRFIDANFQAAELMSEGHIVFSPISHSHPVAKTGMLDALDLDFWLKQDLSFIEWCDSVYVMTIDGWSSSKGIQAEVEFARKIGKPIHFI